MLTLPAGIVVLILIVALGKPVLSVVKPLETIRVHNSLARLVEEGLAATSRRPASSDTTADEDESLK